MTKRSTLDVAYEAIKNRGSAYPFLELWNEVSKKQEFTSEEKLNLLSQFYTNITLDGRFVNVGDNTWNLREKLRSDQIKIEISEVYSDVDEGDDDLEEKSLLIQAGEVTLEETGIIVDEDASPLEEDI